jgi:peptidyl-prolyl cis-trans isomerase D
MFDFVRQHNKIMQFLLVLLIFPSFVLFGIDGYNRFREKGEAVAVVDGQDITQSEWDNALRVETQKLRESMPNLDAKWLDSPEVKYEILERMVRDRLLSTASTKLYLSVSDQRLAQELQKNPTIASLRKPDGSLDIERYKQLLASQGMSPESFEGRMRADLAVQQVIMGVAKGSFMPTALKNIATSAFNEQREIQVQFFKGEDFTKEVKSSDEQLMAFYKAHSEEFKSIESADVEYLLLDMPSIEKTVSVNESDLRTYFDQNNAKLVGQEERRASHILIAAAKDAPADVRSKARAKAQELLAAIKKDPSSFADLAKKNSQDTASAAKGGDLDFFTRGAMVKPFEDAAFSLQKGQVSDVVESDFGYHIIKLTDVKALHTPSFEEMRPTLEAQLRKQGAQKKFAEAAELFTNLVYEQSDTLKPAADKLKLEIHTLNGISSQTNPAQLGALKNPKILSALFSKDSIDKKRNTEAIELAPNLLASARIVKYTPSRILSFEEVKDRVKVAYERENAVLIAKKTALEKQAFWKEHPEAARLGTTLVVSRQATQKLPQSVVEAALKVSTKSFPAWTAVDLGAQGYAVVEVSKVIPFVAQTDNVKTVPGMNDSAQQAISAAENLAYYNFLKSSFKAKINAPAPQSVSAVGLK